MLASGPLAPGYSYPLLSTPGFCFFPFLSKQVDDLYRAGMQLQRTSQHAPNFAGMYPMFSAFQPYSGRHVSCLAPVLLCCLLCQRRPGQQSTVASVAISAAGLASIVAAAGARGVPRLCRREGRMSSAATWTAGSSCAWSGRTASWRSTTWTSGPSPACTAAPRPRRSSVSGEWWGSGQRLRVGVAVKLQGMVLCMLCMHAQVEERS